MNYNIEIKKDDIKGRYCIATNFIKGGDIIIEEEPYSFVPRDAYLEVCCSYCGILNIDGTVMAISNDDTIRYCSEKCIINDYNNHIQSAESLKKLSKLGIIGSGTEPLRLILKIAGNRKLENKNIMKIKDIPLLGKSNTYDNIKCLEAAKSFIDLKTIEELNQIAKTISNIANEYKLIMNEDEVLHLLLAIQCNAHQILDNNERAIGLGLFPFTSMLNHSCSPNCSHHFEITSNGIPKLIMRSIKDINPGEEICYSYVNLYQSTSNRKLQLQKAYSFTCNCLRCSNIDINDNCIDELNINSDEEVAILGKKIQSYSNFSLNIIENHQEVYDNLNAILIELIPLTNIYHKYVLQCYILIAKSGYLIASSNISEEKSLEILKYSFSFLLLALGCIYRMTNTRQYETGELELLTAKVLFSINNLESKKFNNINDFSNIILDLIKENGELNLYLNPNDNDVQNLIEYGFEYSKIEFEKKLKNEKKIINYEDLYITFATTGIEIIRCCKGDDYIINILLKDLTPELTVGYLYF